MPDAQYRNLACINSVIDQVGIANERRPAHAGSSNHLLRRFRMLCDQLDNPAESGLHALCALRTALGNIGKDFVKLAQGMGVEGSRAETTTEFAAQFADAMQRRGPRLIEAVLPN